MLTHRVAYNPHIHIAKNLIALIDALLAAAPTVPYSKTVIGDDQIKVAHCAAERPRRARECLNAFVRWCRSIRRASAWC